jgi:GT2 family glycosyltransferase
VNMNEYSQNSTPHIDTSLISIIVCTRNRNDSICMTLHSILANTYQNFELIIIDQSTNDVTEKAIAPFLADYRLHYVRSNTIGVSLSKNLGLATANSDIVLMTDDDCVVPEDWIQQMKHIFASHPKVAIAFCDVVAAQHDKTGFIPVSVSKKSGIVDSIKSWIPTDGVNIGIGASMALRRSVIQGIGGFDTLLGPGRPFRTAEETDITLRAVLRGYHIYRMNHMSVRHYGFRTLAEGRENIRNSMYGVAAVCAKLLKCGHWSILPFYLGIFMRMVICPLFENVIRLRKPPVWGRMIYLVKGFIHGYRVPVDINLHIFNSYNPVVEPVSGCIPSQEA